MRLTCSVPLLLALAACASGGRRDGEQRPVEPTTEQTTRLETGEGTVELRTTRSDPTNEFPVDAPPDRLWKALPVVYAQLEVPVTMRLPEERAMGNRAFRTRRLLGGVRLGRYLDCGNRLGVSNAETYEVTIRLETRVLAAAGGGSKLATVVEGTAKPIDVSGGSVSCSSTGQLEKRLVTMVAEQVRRG